jgi:hypothetical protein
MSTARLFLVLVLAIPLFSAKSHADDTDNTADVRCLMVMLVVLAKAPGATEQTAAITSAMYYLGRLDGRSPKLSLEDALAAEGAKMTPADFRSEAVRCGTTITERGKQIQGMGKDLIERGK